MKSQFGKIKAFALSEDISAGRLLLDNPLYPQERIPAAVVSKKGQAGGGALEIHLHGRNVVPLSISAELG